MESKQGKYSHSKCPQHLLCFLADLALLAVGFAQGQLQQHRCLPGGQALPKRLWLCHLPCPQALPVPLLCFPLHPLDGMALSCPLPS